MPGHPGAPGDPAAEVDQLDVLVVYVPAEATESLLDALFAAGAGVIGDYQECAFVSHGTGRFRPVGAAQPAIGLLGRREQVAEDRVEVTVRRGLVPGVVAALRTAHPYQEPAFHVLRTTRLTEAADPTARP